MIIYFLKKKDIEDFKNLNIGKKNLKSINRI